MNLLARLPDLGHGKLVDAATGNPFLHDREKTRQPRELFEWLFQLALLVFPLDVGVRRIQLDAGEWRKVTRTLRRWLIFWRPPEGTLKGDAALSSLLAKRDEARARTESAPKMAARPELFQPKQPPQAVRPDAHIESNPSKGVSSGDVVEEGGPGKKRRGPGPRRPAACWRRKSAPASGKMIESKKWLMTGALCGKILI